MSVLADDHLIKTHADLAMALDGSEDSFTGQLLTLISKADPQNRARLRIAFPRHVAAWEWWQMDGYMTSAELTAAIAGIPDGGGS